MMMSFFCELKMSTVVNLFGESRLVLHERHNQQIDKQKYRQSSGRQENFGIEN